MTSTPRWRSVLTCLAVAALLIALAAPVAASPAADGSASLMGDFVRWLTHLGELVGFDLDSATGADSALPSMDPNGIEATPPILLLDPDDSYSTNGGDGGETLPSMDPNG